MGRASCGSSTPHWIRNEILDFQKTLSVKLAVENGQICNKTTMGRLQRIGEIFIVDETDSFKTGHFREDG